MRVKSMSNGVNPAAARAAAAPPHAPPWRAAVRRRTLERLRLDHVWLLLAVAVALAAAPAVRGTTAELGGMLGTSWPFSMRHCPDAAMPGCAVKPPARSSVPTR